MIKQDMMNAVSIMIGIIFFLNIVTHYFYLLIHTLNPNLLNCSTSLSYHKHTRISIKFWLNSFCPILCYHHLPCTVLSYCDSWRMISKKIKLRYFILFYQFVCVTHVTIVERITFLFRYFPIPFLGRRNDNPLHHHKQILQISLKRAKNNNESAWVDTLPCLSFDMQRSG